MPDKRYKIGGTTYYKDGSGKLVPIEKSPSIADGKVSGFKTPKIPAHEQILAEPTRESTSKIPLFLSTPTPGAPGGVLELDVPNMLDPEGRKLALQQGLGLAASFIPGGGFAANVAKSAGGTMLGNLLGQAQEGKMPDLGETAETGLTDAAINTALGGTLMGLTKGAQFVQPFVQNVQKRGVKEAIARAIASSPLIRPSMSGGQYIDPLRERNVASGLTTRESITAGKNVPMSVGSATGSKGIQFIESLLAPEESKVLQQLGTGVNVNGVETLVKPKVRDVFIRTTGERGQEGLSRLKGVREAFSARSKVAFDEMKNIAKQNTKSIQGPPASTTTTGMYGPKTTLTPTKANVEGPIFLSNSVELAQEVLPQIRAAMKDIRTPELMGDLAEINRKLSAFQKERIIPYASARQLQDNINNLVYENPNELLSSNTRRLLLELKKQVDSDMLTSMEAHWTPGAADKYRDALGITVEKYKTITERLAKAFSKGVQTPETFYNEAFKNATSAREYSVIVGKDTAGAEFLARVRDKHFNPAVGAFDAANALADWGKPETREVAKTILTAAQRAGYEQFLKRQAAIAGDTSNIGVLALGTQQANAALGTAKDLANLPGNPGNLFSTNALRIGAVLGLSKFTKQVLLNPARAREASRLLSVNPVRQPQAKLDAQRFILGSKLGTILLRAENGEEVEYNTETGKATKLQ